jgi:uncharacterized protein YdeI (YjbR/CyaY-like superfamily)
MKSNTGLPIISFQTQKKWRDWLSKNHSKADGVWLRLYKKNSTVKSIIIIIKMMEEGKKFH